MKFKETTHEAAMERAIELSIAGVDSGLGGPFGCVIVKDGEILSTGENRVTSTNDPTAHAEIVAVREACRKLGAFELRGCMVYTSCEPCPMCLAALYWARVDRVYFGATREDAASIGFDDEFLYSELALPVSERELKLRPLLRDQALAAFRHWSAKSDRVDY